MRSCTALRYSFVRYEAGVPFPERVAAELNQKHDVIMVRPGNNGALPDMLVGNRARTLLNQVCGTAAHHAAHHVLSTGHAANSRWPSKGGWWPTWVG